MDTEVDYRAELEAYDWSGATWSFDKLIARSPFRAHDNTPSFYVHLDGDAAGTWGDSGAEEGSEYKRGGFVKLLAYLREESEADTREYLGLNYDADLANKPRKRTLNIGRLRRAIASTAKKTRQTLDHAILAGLAAVSPYLVKRGISEATQRLFSIGAADHYVAMPWFHADGSLANVKYRSTRQKSFWYAKGGAPIHDLIYGIDVVYREKWREVMLCESEIDALASVEAGCNAIAAGGSTFSAARRDLIVRSPIEVVVIAADNDEAGDKFAQEVIGQLARTSVELRRVKFAADEKDVAEALAASGVERVRALRDGAESVGSPNLSKRI
ncbi:toprim domain-containing protein [Alkalihalobacillus sp. LMS6]|jgi:hypothetical protein|uniref:toprim domain-containing protein n=1 Tax=Alkalihalobacillus sp. LMS6 TaxID=2924034 RepID=UPI0020D0B5A0|nr:toprim domain-containing protein [Alkalihalobacillus sp. LMS6]UTR05195.1 toprim domain-containing protein [Alkalihalobacillus sp. LMS6]